MARPTRPPRARWSGPLAVALLLAITACHRAASPPDRPPPPPIGTRAPAEVDPESGQGRAEEAGRALLGRPAPRLVIRTIDGDVLRLADLYGRTPVYLKLWATWCVPCREQMAGYERDYEALGRQIAFVAVNAGFEDDEGEVRSFRDRAGLRMPVAVDDGSIAAALHVRVTPEHIVIGRDGRVLYAGHLADDRLHAALAAAIAQPPQDPVESAAVPTARAYLVGDAPRDLPAATTSTGDRFPICGPYPDARPRVLVFFSPWCESYLATARPRAADACRQVREQATALAPRGRARWLAVASGLWASSTDVADYEREHGVAIPVALDADGVLFRAFGVRDIPTVIVLDAAGRIVRELRSTDDDLAAAIREIDGSPR